MLGAEEKIIQLETELFQEVRVRVRGETQKLQSTARALATLDALARWPRPPPGAIMLPDASRR